MPVYQVVRKSDGVEVTRYCAGQVTESLDGNAFPLSDFDHIEYVDGTSITPTGPRRLTKLAFIDRLGDAAYVAILAMAKVDVQVEAFVKRFEMATPEADGTSIDLNDPRTVVGVTAIGAALEAQQIVAAGWAHGVLNG